MTIRSAFCLMLVFAFLPTVSSFAECEFQPSELVKVVRARQDYYTSLVAFADSSTPDQQPLIPSPNIRTYTIEETRDFETDTVHLKALVHPTGTILDASVIKNGRWPTSDCLALQWAADTKMIGAVKEGKTIAAWRDVQVFVGYGRNDARAWAKAEQEPNKTSKDMDEAPNDRVPAPDEFVPVEEIARMVHEVQPEYPKDAMDQGHQGKVVIKCLVTNEGTVRDALVMKSSGYPALDSAALSVAHQNRFKPAVQHGRPVAMWVAYTVKFSLEHR